MTAMCNTPTVNFKEVCDRKLLTIYSGFHAHMQDVL